MNIFKKIKNYIANGLELAELLKNSMNSVNKFNSGDYYDKGEAIREILDNAGDITKKTKRIRRKAKRDFGNKD